MENRTNLLTGNYASLVLSGNYEFDNITKNGKVRGIHQKFGQKKLLGAVIFGKVHVEDHDLFKDDESVYHFIINAIYLLFRIKSTSTTQQL